MVGTDRASWTLELLALQLERDTAVKLSARYVSRLLRLGGCRRGRPRPALRIPVRGRRAVLERIETLIAQSSPEAEVFYVDEADIDLNPRIGTVMLGFGLPLTIITLVALIVRASRSWTNLFLRSSDELSRPKNRSVPDFS